MNDEDDSTLGSSGADLGRYPSQAAQGHGPQVAWQVARAANGSGL